MQKSGLFCLQKDITSVVEDNLNECAVSKERSHWCHILKKAVLKGGIDESDRLEFHICESEEQIKEMIYSMW